MGREGGEGGRQGSREGGRPGRGGIEGGSPELIKRTMQIGLPPGVNPPP